jgi:hypothetical protein
MLSGWLMTVARHNDSAEFTARVQPSHDALVPHRA